MQTLENSHSCEFKLSRKHNSWDIKFSASKQALVTCVRIRAGSSTRRVGWSPKTHSGIRPPNSSSINKKYMINLKKWHVCEKTIKAPSIKKEKEKDKAPPIKKKKKD